MILLIDRNTSGRPSKLLEKDKKNRANILRNEGEINLTAKKTPFFKGVMAIIYNLS